MRCYEKSGWLAPRKSKTEGGEAVVDRFLFKFLVCVAFLALALSIKAC